MHMQIRVGCDIVHIGRFNTSAQRGGDGFLSSIFSADELATRSDESLAGLFAAKEAAVKALSIPAGNWRRIGIVFEPDGRPALRVADMPQQCISSDISISHDGEYAFAVATFIIV